ncbi:uncharacterized protein LOC130919508 isoform X1 [Corythoichthys intestinalis]|uniref:uncharacterized protein LOC130919508 isoform X1 n=1 Tax=Corythoichthys intestinalis TaxID=161448 RepID=UPI0025A4E884|nr:uncharacterized protein LOC130919508 isoform X1 [Corythoichthys intestinalis]
MALSKQKIRYIDTLDTESRNRYEQKIELIGVDPYEVKKDSLTTDLDSLPAISYYDIVNYLIHTKSAYTMQDLNSLKAMDALNQCRSGWVMDVMTMKCNDKVLTTGRVRHSQRMNDTPLRPWVISSLEGSVECAHCDCMAGLGEVCCHVGSLLFWVDENYRANKALTVTQKKAYWPVPSYVDKVAYSEIQDIDFTSTEVRKREFECTLIGAQTPKRMPLKMPLVPEPTEEEMSCFARKLSNTGVKPAVLAVISDHQEIYIPEILKEEKLPVNIEDMDNYQKCS